MKWHRTTAWTEQSYLELAIDDGSLIARLRKQRDQWELEIPGFGWAFSGDRDFKDENEVKDWAVSAVRYRFCLKMEMMTQFLKESNPPF